MHIVKIAWAAWLMVAAALTGAASAQDHPVTCSVAQIQCFQDCPTKAPDRICNRYCPRKMNECMTTGNWIGQFGDPFTAYNMIRQ